ncbi:hypothetical protein GQ53DRAFT_741803 [Thozetella sp. PMI_491]|nr:hypothetical protein GQ53DRAFT_741803 [Thozetella sp. PMI_491]
MAPKKRAQAVHGEEQTRNIRPISGPSKKVKTGTSKVQVRDSSDYENDPGRTSSWAFQQQGLVDWDLKQENKRSKDFLDTHNKVTQAEKAAMLTVMAEHDRGLHGIGSELSSTNFHLNLTKGLERGHKIHISIDRHSHVLFEAMESIIDISDSLLRCHEKTEAEFGSHCQSSLGTQWRKDIQGTREMLRFGREYGEALAESIIIPKTEMIVSNTDEQQPTESSKGLAFEMFEGSRKRAREGTWGQAARAQMTALAGVITTTNMK